MSYTRRWLRPLKLREYYVDPFVPHVRDADYQLYWAVMDGSIRARLKGRTLTKKEAGKLRESRWGDEGDDHALPPDIDLSVEDAKLIWGSSDLRALADMPVVAKQSAHRAGLDQLERRPHGRPARDRAQLAIEELFPNGVPNQAMLPDKLLCGRVGDWLDENNLLRVSGDTILRASGRRRK